MIFRPLRLFKSWCHYSKYTRFLGVSFDEWISLSSDKIYRLIKMQTAQKRLFRKPIYKQDNWGGLYVSSLDIILVTAYIFDGVPSPTQQVILVQKKGWIVYTLYKQGVSEEIYGHPMVDPFSVANWIRSDSGKAILLSPKSVHLHLGFLHSFADGVHSEKTLSFSEVQATLVQEEESVLF